jgi:bifunctional DNA-binding transcriptional regulator/antitoxin component of YhaV-PrlF toxin-antitoxin module
MERFTVTIDGSGRLLLPSRIRNQLKLKRGSELVGLAGKQGLVLKTRAQALLEAQEHFSRLRPSGTLWSEELIHARRKESRREREN